MKFSLEEMGKIKKIVESVEKNEKNPFLLYRQLISAVNQADFMPESPKNDYNEIEKKNKAYKANRDFCLLSSQLNIVGFYNSVEFIQIFLVDKKKGKENSIVKNIYTLFTYSEVNYVSTSIKYVGKLTPINKNYSVGVMKGVVSKREADKYFFNIQNGNFVVNDDNCEISPKLFLLPKNFIPKNNMKIPSMLNNIIKPNYWGDNYLIEFFDEEKNFFDGDPNSREYIEKICNIVKNISEFSIDLSKVRDRFGNIIFQFPITICKTIVESVKDFVSVHVKIESHPLLAYSRNLSINVQTSCEDSITGESYFESNALSFDRVCEIGDDDNLQVSIRDRCYNLLLHNAVYIPIKNVNISMNIGLPNIPQRLIKDRNGSVISTMDVLVRNSFDVGKRLNKTYETYIQERVENNNIIRHSDDYLIVGKDDRKKALEFISKKINRNKWKEICLWDPYLSAVDIIDALYSENTGIYFRCITSYKKSKTVKDGELLTTDETVKSSLEYKLDVINDFSALSNNIGINLKFLAQHDEYGWDFHDRFLILTPAEDTQLPEVYSLGTSVNMLGKTHHMIQKVTNPNVILHNFDDLWDKLNNSNCLLIEYKDGEIV